MSEAEKAFMLDRLMVIPTRMFIGDLADLVKLFELYTLRIGCDGS